MPAGAYRHIRGAIDESRSQRTTNCRAVHAHVGRDSQRQHQRDDVERGSIMDSWSQRGVIPIQARGMTKRVEKYRAGNSQKAFKTWAHGAGADRIVPIDEFNKWVNGFRPGQTIGSEMIKDYLMSINADVTKRTVDNYLALAIAMSGSATETAKYKQEARDTAERSLRRAQA